VKFSAFLAASAVTALSALPGASVAATPRLDIPSFNHLRAKANDSVNITIGGPLLRLVSRFAANHEDADQEEQAALSILNDVSSIQVRNFSFDEEDAYSMADVDSVRKQLDGPCWNHLVQQQKRASREATDVFMCLEDGKVMGIAVIASEPREFTIVNVIGNIDIDKLSKLEGQFGIPKMAKD
jgi:uncharacterized protein DUF4252